MDTAPVAQNTVCRLLNIPAELRNRIYDFAAEKSLEELRDESYRTAGGYYAWESPHDYVWKAGREHREFTGLTMVCRQVRAEFLLMYNKRTTFTVSLKYLSRYIDVFVKIPGVADETVVGNLAVYGERGGTTPINLESLMGLAKKARALSIKWYSNTGPDTLDLSTLFDAFLRLDDHPVLHEYVSTSITKIEARNVLVCDLKIRLTIEDASWKGWMAYTTHRYEEEEFPAGEDDYFNPFESFEPFEPETYSVSEALEVWAAAVHLSVPQPEGTAGSSLQDRYMPFFHNQLLFSKYFLFMFVNAVVLSFLLRAKDAHQREPPQITGYFTTEMHPQSQTEIRS